MNPGDILDGRYQITARLGAGGMGEVYKATHTFLNAPRVIKIVHPQIAANADAKDRFTREARVATKVQHTNVATLHDFASLPDGSQYMVWEFIDGENLAQRLRTRGTLPPRQAIGIALQALKGLEAIHRAGIIHRDISPENLMITPDDTVKIIDLGVAKLEDSDQSVAQTRTGIFVGKLRYAAPEQLGFLPEGEKIDGRADLYALAMVIVELLTGRPPYEAKSPHEYFMHHAREIPMTTISLPPNFPGSEALAQALQKALSRNRDERYATARDFAAALEEIERTLPKEEETATAFVPLDADETWRPSANAPLAYTPPPVPTTPASTAPSLTPPPAAPAVAATAAAAAEPTLRTPLPAAETVRTPFPAAATPAPPPKSSNTLAVVLAILVVLILAGGAGAYVLWPRITGVISSFTGTKKPAATQVATVETTKSLTPTPQPAQSSIAVTPPTVTTQTTATQPPAPQPVVTEPTRTASQSQPAQTHPREQQIATVPMAEPQQTEPQRRAPTNYFDRPGRYNRNERALDHLRAEMNGVTQVALLAGSDQTMVYRAIHRYLPNLTFDADSPVVIKFGSAEDRLGYTAGGLGPTAIIEKNGRVIFRYNLPSGDRGAAADAFAQTLADALQ